MGSKNVTSKSPFSVAWRLCSAHFIGHCLALGAAAIAPLLTAPTSTDQGTSGFLSSRQKSLVQSEGYLILFSFLLALYKMSRGRACPEAAMETFLWQGQAIVLVVLWPLNSAVFTWWALIFALLHLLDPLTEPAIPGAHQGALEELTQRKFDALSDPSAGGGEGNNAPSAQVVVLYSHLSSPCHQHHPMLADLAHKYSGPNLKWGRLDVARFPEVGDRFGIQGAALASPVLFSLPVLLLVSGGMVKARIDSSSETAGWGPFVMRSSGLTKAAIVRRFQLDSWLVKNHSKSS